MVRLIHLTMAKCSMNLSTLARTSLRHLSPLRSTSLTRENATESVAIEGRNINFSIPLNGSLNPCSSSDDNRKNRDSTTRYFSPFLIPSIISFTNHESK
ncbi:hypothetical protein V6Z12_D04G039400 [Gossypium hirsutum]